MRRIFFATLASCVFALLSALTAPAQAGDYRGHYQHRHVWHGSDCCARTVVRYEPGVRYLRLVEQLPYCAYCDNPPARYVPDPSWPLGCAADGGGWVWSLETTCY